MRICFAIAALVAVFAAATPSLAAAGFSDWAAIVVAADYRAHSGADSEVFDNARRDISAELVRMGFSPANVMQFSVRPERYPADQPRHSDAQTIATSLWDLSNRTSGGCLAYFTSHGNTDGISLGDEILSPKKMNQIVSNACGDRPTVVIVSACFSGVFVPELAASNRMIMTAARPDRTSFGCGEMFRYTFFDDCMVQDLPAAGDFDDLTKNVIGCVSAKEKAQKLQWSSQPQVSMGADVAAKLPHWK